MKKFYLLIATALTGLIMLSVTAVKAQNMERYITLIVKQGEWISLIFEADTVNTFVKVVSGTTDTTFYVDIEWPVMASCYAQSDTMRIYGNVKEFDCKRNDTKIIGLNASNNKELKRLDCSFNHLSFLDVSGLTALEVLNCGSNRLSSLNLSGLTALRALICCFNNFSSLDISELTFLNCLDCGSNSLSSLNLSGLTALTSLSCYNNHLSSLDVSELTSLTTLFCSYNNLFSLDVSGLTALEHLLCFDNHLSSIKISGCESLFRIVCYENQLSACGLDSLFHQLSIRTENKKGKIYIKDRRFTNPGTFSCRDTIATNKFWNVLDYNIENEKPIKNTTYACPYFTLGVKEIKQDNIRFYPNPVNATLYIESKADISRVEVYDVLGRRQLSTTYSNTIDCSTLSAGIYILKLTTPQGNLIKKFVKE